MNSCGGKIEPTTESYCDLHIFTIVHMCVYVGVYVRNPKVNKQALKYFKIMHRYYNTNNSISIN